MPKPQTISGYEDMVTDACERVLVTLLRGLGPWKESVFLVGGLVQDIVDKLVDLRRIVEAGPDPGLDLVQDVCV